MVIERGLDRQIERVRQHDDRVRQDRQRRLDISSTGSRELNLQIFLERIAVAIEDSPHGIAAAKGAGLFCLAVPNEVTRTLDLSAADLVIGSFEEMTLRELLAVVPGGLVEADG